jgi:hypothetical protein
VSIYLEYLILVFFGFLGVLQLAATSNGLRGLSFFKKQVYGYLFAVVTIVGSFLWFFLSKNRCLQGVEGVEAFVSLSGMAIVVFAFTATVSSRINRNRMPLSQKTDEEEGLGALRTMTYFQAMSRRFRGRKQR